MRMLEQLPALERLELSGTGMRQTGLRDAADSLRSCTRLTYLDLSRLWCYDPRNSGADGMTAIQEHYDAGDEFMRMLPSWPALTHLNLEDMYLGADATHLAASLHALPGLTFLNLSSSDIGTQAMTNIAAALRWMPALVELKMCQCGIDEVGAQALVRVLPQCVALRVLKLRPNPLTDAGVQGLAAVIQQCPNLTFLDLRSTQLGQATIDEIVAAWRAQHEERGECTWKGRRGGIKCTAKHFA
jgi:Ran GTPase-activating protein (RanGAP) involved in mRNA processing and transport